MSETIIPSDIVDEMRDSYMEYAMSVIVGRALPDVRDGLKPVHRRVLFSMNEQGNDFNKPFRKSARVVGDVIGKYHPHGDSAVYDTIVRMTQAFSMRYQLVDGQGNFGSVDGDSPAAMRYTEVRMKRMAQDLMIDLDKDTVDFQPKAKEIRKIMNENELGKEVAVRVGVKGGGCSGLTYTLDFDSRKTKFDLEYESEGMKILVDKKSHLYIKDTEIDWSYSLMDRGLKFNNPLAKSSCGCKTSFMFDAPQQEEDFKPSWM